MWIKFLNQRERYLTLHILESLTLLCSVDVVPRPLLFCFYTFIPAFSFSNLHESLVLPVLSPSVSLPGGLSYFPRRSYRPCGAGWSFPFLHRPNKKNLTGNLILHTCSQMSDLVNRLEFRVPPSRYIDVFFIPSLWPRFITSPTHPGIPYPPTAVAVCIPL